MASKGYRKLSLDKKGSNNVAHADEEEVLLNAVEENTQNNEEDWPPTRFSKKQKIFFGVFTVLLVGVGLTLGILLNKKADWITGVSRVMRSDRKLTIEEIMDGRYSYSSYSLTWTSDDSYLHSEGGLVKFNMTNSQTETFISYNDMMQYKYADYQLSPDGKWLLLSNNSRRLYRHSSYADYYIQDLRPNNEREDPSKSTIIRIKKPDDDPKEQIRYCGWARKQNAIVFVYKCNIYYIPKAVEVSERYFQLTDNGVPKKVFNGVPDWVYEEEILASTHAIEVSKDGRYLSFVTFNATDVPFYKFPVYGPDQDQYTTIDKIAYPKAGYPNPTIKVSVMDLEQAMNNSSNKKFESTRSHPKPPSKIVSGEYYYAVMKWTSGNELFIQWLNRAQNVTVCMTYAPNSDTAKIVEEHTTPNGWIDDDYVKPKFSNDGSYYITMLPKDDNRHLAKVSLQSKGGPSIEYLTQGKYWVQDISCYDSKNEIIYFRSTEGSPRHRHVYSIDVKTKERNCITCDLIKDPDNPNVACTYHYATFSKQCSWVSLMCQGPFLPTVSMVNVKSKRVYQLLAGNTASRQNLKERDLPINVYYNVMSDGYNISVKETRPPDFNPNKKYAVLFDVYGGPNTQKVTDIYDIGFDDYLVIVHDIILVTFDARGTGFNGYSFLHAVYKKLGKYEAIDAENVAKHLSSQSYIDSNRMAIWGWSYGGFYSATALAESNLIKTAVAVAPVTDWRYYDTVYSERYMGLPTADDNLQGYIESSIMSKANKFRGKNFLLIHGTADDNVHFQNSAHLSAALIKAQIKFRSQYYPDRAHGIQSNGHVFYLIADYLLAKLKHRDFPKSQPFGFH